MYFLGQAANLRGQVFRHTFAFGTAKNSLALKEHLAKRYGSSLDNVRLYHTGRTALSVAIKYALSLSSSDDNHNTRSAGAKNSSSTKQPQKDATPEVVITAMTCYAVVQAVRAAGANPIFADIDPKTLHFNGETLKKTLKTHPGVRCIVIQNSLGRPCDITEIEKIAEDHKIPLVEDLAHCAGISYADGREAGTVGVATALSFGKGKSIDTTSGGALIIRGTTSSVEPSSNTTSSVKKTTQNTISSTPAKKPPFSDRFRDRWYPFYGLCIRGFYHIKLGRHLTSFLLKLHLIQKSADAALDENIRLTHWQAKLALRQLEKMPKNRPPLREFYFVKDRDHTLKDLESAGFIMYDIWYETPVAPERYFKKSGFNPEECPVATRLSSQIINLPTYYPKNDLEPARKIILKHQKGAK